MYMGVLAMPCPSDWVLYCCCLIRFCRPIRLCFGNVACSPEFRTCQCWHMLFHDILLQVARTVGSMYSLVLSEIGADQNPMDHYQFHYCKCHLLLSPIISHYLPCSDKPKSELMLHWLLMCAVILRRQMCWIWWGSTLWIKLFGQLLYVGG